MLKTPSCAPEFRVSAFARLASPSKSAICSPPAAVSCRNLDQPPPTDNQNGPAASTCDVLITNSGATSSAQCEYRGTHFKHQEMLRKSTEISVKTALSIGLAE